MDCDKKIVANIGNNIRIVRMKNGLFVCHVRFTIAKHCRYELMTLFTCNSLLIFELF